jgi:hypothetical protein
LDRARPSLPVRREAEQRIVELRPLVENDILRFGARQKPGSRDRLADSARGDFSQAMFAVFHGVDFKRRDHGGQLRESRCRGWPRVS